MRLGKSYFTVNAPYQLPLARRREIRDALKAAGLYERTKARNSKPQAEALAAEIKAALGFDMTVNETADLGGF